MDAIPARPRAYLFALGAAWLPLLVAVAVEGRGGELPPARAAAAIPAHVPPAILPPALPPEPPESPEPPVATASEVDGAEEGKSEGSFLFVHEVAGRRFAILAELEAPVARAPGAQLIETEAGWPLAVVQRFEYDTVPAEAELWHGQRLRVAGVCEEPITEPVQLTLAHLAESEDTRDGSLRGITAHGRAYLAAELKRCSIGSWARDARLPVAELAIALPAAAPALEQAAFADLAATPEGRETAARWAKTYGGSLWNGNAHGRPEVRHLRHPRTGERWLIVHVDIGHGCGEPGFRLLGVYRIDEDAGTPLRVYAGSPEMLFGLHDAIDIDGDGDFELHGRSYHGEPILTSNQTEPLRELYVPALGCSC